MDYSTSKHDGQFLLIHSLKSTYHGGIIPLPSSYLLAAGRNDGHRLPVHEKDQAAILGRHNVGRVSQVLKHATIQLHLFIKNQMSTTPEARTADSILIDPDLP
jgi:hypothetical protein